jgi:ankyrin repeat protein
LLSQIQLVPLHIGCQNNQQDVRGVAPIHIAAKNGDALSLSVLVAAGADVTLIADGGRCVLLALCEGSGDDHGMSAARMVGLALFTTLFCSHNTKLMTASMVHVTNRTPPGSDNPSAWR